MITAFFADVVGFTTLSAALSAGQVMDMLDRLYTALDALSAAHDVFKIDTIGDAYLVAANLSGDQVIQLKGGEMHNYVDAQFLYHYESLAQIYSNSTSAHCTECSLSTWLAGL